MNKTHAIISSRTMILLIGAVLLCAIGLTGAVGATQAALSFESEQYQARMAQTHLGVALMEQSGSSDEAIVVNMGDEAKRLGFEGSTDGKLLQQVAGEGEDAALLVLDGDKQMVPGKPYTEKIFAKNASDMGEYVRLTIRKYWADESGNKIYNANPALIELGLAENSGWVKSDAESTDEMLVFYYKDVLDARATTSAVIDTIKLSPAVTEMSDLLKSMNKDDANLQIVLSAEVDAIQTNHIVDAVQSAWGVSLDSINALGAGWKDVKTTESSSVERKEA
ncbi:MAG: hypothetical protein HFJ64_06440 [Eggerthellaceae bacterium]|nr:hypothetical protein [Eggerthellaceae bacterium]